MPAVLSMPILCVPLFFLSEMLKYSKYAELSGAAADSSDLPGFRGFMAPES